MIIPYDFPPTIGASGSIQVSPADIRNRYMERDAATGGVIWKDFPGLRNVSSGSGADRGEHVMADVRYLINGTSLIKEDSANVRTTLGTISGGDRAIFADDGTNLLIVASNVLYKYNGVNVSTITQSVVSNVEWVAFLNDTFVIGGDNQRFALSDTGDPDTWNALNFGTADVDSDTLIRGFVFRGRLRLLGSKHTENWIYTGSGTPPIARSSASQTSNIGIIGKYAVCETDDFMYFMGDDKKVYKSSGSNAVPITDYATSEIIDGYTFVTDCVMSSFVWQGQTFVLLKFPGAGDALLYSESLGYWVTLSSGTNRYSRESWLATSIQSVYGRLLATDFSSGNTYELDEDTTTDNGNNRLRMMVGNKITGAAIGAPSNTISLSYIHVPMQTGVALETGQGSDPEIFFQFSNDGGQVYQPEDFLSIGTSGQYLKKVTLFQFCTGYEIVPKIMISDPVPLTIYSGGSAEIMNAGY